MLKALALSTSVLAFAGGLALAETAMTREPATGRFGRQCFVVAFDGPLACLRCL